MSRSDLASSASPQDGEAERVVAGVGISPQSRATWLEDLFDTTNDLIQIVGADGALRLVNRAWSERLGYSEAEAIGRNVFDLIAPDCQEHCQQVFAALLRGQVAQPIECAFITRHGRRLSLEGQLNVVFVEGRPAEVRGIFRDVSERKEMQEALQQLNATLEDRVNQRTRELEIAQARLEEAQRLASVGHWEMDLVSGALHWSDEICRISGLDPETVTPRYSLFIESVHPEDRDRLESAYQQSLASRQPVDLPYRLVRPDGSVRHIHARWTTDFDAEGHPLRSIGTSQDVTEFERSQRDLRESEIKLRSLFDSSSLGLVLIENGERFGLVNAAFEAISGLTRGVVLAPPPDQGLPPMLQDLLQLGHAVLSSWPMATAIKHWRRPDGKTAVVQLRAIGVAASADGDNPSLVWVQVEDISDRLEAEERLRLAAMVFHSAAEGIFVTDAEGVIVDVNAALCRITGYDREEMLGQTPRLFKSGLHSQDFYRQIWTTLESEGTWSGEIVNRARNGSSQDMLETIGVVLDEHGHITNYVALLSDIRLLKDQQRQLERLALYDSLTGLPNRVLLGQRLDQSMSAVMQSGEAIAICYVDLDGFKEINDRYGHFAGDTLLQTIAKRMQEMLPDRDVVARLGGDEFVVILHGMEECQPELPFVQHLLQSLVEPISWNAQLLEVTASIGVTFYSLHSGPEAADQLLRKADQAMYEAKRQGKNRYWVFANAARG